MYNQLLYNIVAIERRDKTMKDTEALKKHFEWKGKYETRIKCKISTEEDLALAYTPGVADACMAIYENSDLSYSLTGRANSVAVITDGTAILGLGDIGPVAGMPVMEGKCALFKKYGNVDAIALCLNTKDTEEIIKTIKYLEGSFGGINLEDISAPRCFEIEERLKKELEIPVFHDDQHGTAIVVGAALINASKLVKKDITKLKGVINGAGAAGISIAKFLLSLGVEDIILVDKCGIINKDEVYENKAFNEMKLITNKKNIKGNLHDAIKNVDFFVGVSKGNLLSKEDIKNMNDKAIVFPMANPIPEISYDDAVSAGAYVVGTGSSKYPNQINNALVFPGIFRGALDVRASDINDEMMKAASYAIAGMIKNEELARDNIMPKVINEGVHKRIAQAVKEAAIKTNVARINL